MDVKTLLHIQAYILAWVATVICLTDDNSRKSSGQDVLLAQLLEKSRYSRMDPPMLDAPTEVQLGIFIASFYYVSDQNMDYGITIYLRQLWRDPRMQFDSTKHKIDIKMEEHSWKKIWIPDTFIRNEKRANFHEITISNRLLRVNATGHMWYVSKLSVTLSCPMELQKYPMDTQACPIMFESFGYKKDVMFYSWLPDPVDWGKKEKRREKKPPQFIIVNHVLRDCSRNDSLGVSCRQIDFVLQREIGYFIIQVFVPSSLIVILSWVSFWISVDAVPARVSLGLITVLTTTTQSTAVNATLPKVAYVKAIDVWMSVCLVFVFCGLCEYAFVNVASRHKGDGAVTRALRLAKQTSIAARDRACRCQVDHCTFCASCGCLPTSDVETAVTVPAPTSKPPEPDGKRRAQRIDKISRLSFPIAFLLFNATYWVVYTSIDVDFA